MFQNGIEVFKWELHLLNVNENFTKLAIALANFKFAKLKRFSLVSDLSLVYKSYLTALYKNTPKRTNSKYN